MLSSFTVKNFKSIVELTLELGRFNVFIGENGCGKTNILEALAMAAGAESERLTNEDLFLRGMRVARATLTTNSFADSKRVDTIKLILACPNPKGEESEQLSDKYHLRWHNNQWVKMA